MRVMAIGAHPDDIELLCGGTLLRCRQRGDAVVMCVVTDGRAGHPTMPEEQLIRTRRSETQAVADALGAELLWLGIPDEQALDTQENRLRVVEAIRRARPDIIITHDADDYHPDHRGAAALVFAASFISSLVKIKTETAPHSKVTPIFTMDRLAGLDFQPEVYVDISGVIGGKADLLRRHASQLEWLKHHDNIDLVEFGTSVARFRGLQCGVTHAEGFRQVKTWPRMTTRRWLPE